MNGIKLYKTAGGWQALHTGPHAEKVKELFGTDTLPTGWTAGAEPEMVLSGIRELNPDCTVELS